MPASFDRRYPCTIEEYERRCIILHTPSTILDPLEDDQRIMYSAQSGELVVQAMASRLHDAV